VEDGQLRQLQLLLLLLLLRLLQLLVEDGHLPVEDRRLAVEDRPLVEDLHRPSSVEHRQLPKERQWPKKKHQLLVEDGHLPVQDLHLVVEDRQMLVENLKLPMMAYALPLSVKCAVGSRATQAAAYLEIAAAIGAKMSVTQRLQRK